MVKGVFKYTPRELVEELESTKKLFNIDGDSDAYRKIVENARIGRQIRFTIDFNVRKRRK